jgi:calcium-dependent protein kinase
MVANDWAKVSHPAKDLIRRMLAYEPSHRIAAVDAYNHPWIQSNKYKGLIQNHAIEKLSDFQMKNKLKMAIMEFISVQVMTSQEKQELLREFQELDKNGDGMVSKNELF